MIRPETQAMINALNEGKALLLTPQGYSMWPLITGTRDNVLIEKCDTPPKKGEVALFLDDQDQFTLHRVLSVKNGKYVFRGDGQMKKDNNIDAARVYAVMKGLYHKSRFVDTSSRLYRVYSAVWCCLPVRIIRVPLICAGLLFCRGRDALLGRRNGGRK